jgi:hypothetical protein
MIKPEHVALFPEKLPRYFLLDGQQRVMALASVILPRTHFKKLFSEDEEMPLQPIFANLKRFPRELVATNDPAGYSFPWVLFNELFDGTAQNRPGYAALSPLIAEKIKRYVQGLRDYQFPVQIIHGCDYATVGEVFRRVNSQGTQLTGAEIHLARIVPHWKGIAKQFRDYRKQLRQKNYELDLTFLMRAITVVECNVPQIKRLADTVARKEERPSCKHLNKTWKQARTAIDKLVRVLQRELLLDRSNYFTSKNTLVPLVYYLAHAGKGQPVARMVKRFFLLSQLSRHYSSSSESVLRRDFRTMKEEPTPRRGLEELVTSVAQQARDEGYRGLKIRPDQVRGVSSQNVFVLLMYILMQNRDASDWGDDGKKLSDIPPKEMQLHHIFPFDFLTKDKGALKVYTEHDKSPAEFREDVNDIANLTFLSEDRNKLIGNAPPWEYLPQYTTKETRKAHFVPENPDLWKADKFCDFLEERRRLLSKAMTSFLKKLR